MRVGSRVISCPSARPPAARRQRRTLPSTLPETSASSATKPTPKTGPACPRSTSCSTPVAASQILTCRSKPAAATLAPLGLKATP